MRARESDAAIADLTRSLVDLGGRLTGGEPETVADAMGRSIAAEHGNLYRFGSGLPLTGPSATLRREGTGLTVEVPLTDRGSDRDPRFAGSSMCTTGELAAFARASSAGRPRPPADVARTPLAGRRRRCLSPARRLLRRPSRHARPDGHCPPPERHHRYRMGRVAPAHDR